MDIGRMRFRVTIEKLAGTVDTDGQENSTWATHGERWAEIEPLSGREFFAARQVQSDTTHRVTIRYLAGITPKMRITYGSRHFDIEGVADIGERNHELRLLCKEVV